MAASNGSNSDFHINGTVVTVRLNCNSIHSFEMLKKKRFFWVLNGQVVWQGQHRIRKGAVSYSQFVVSDNQFVY